MAYTIISSPASLQAVLNAWRAFAAANSNFTDEGVVTISGKRVHSISNGSVFFNFAETYERTLSGLPTQYYASGRITYTKPVATFSKVTPVGQPQCTSFGVHSTNGPFTNLYLFTDSDVPANVTCIHMVLECQPGLFAHMSVGSITKTSAGWTGGEYMTSQLVVGVVGSPNTFTYSRSQAGNQFYFNDSGTQGSSQLGDTGVDSSSYVRYQQSGANVDDFAQAKYLPPVSNQRARFAGSNTSNPSTSDLLYNIFKNGPDSATQRSALFPIYVRLVRWDLPSVSPYPSFLAGYVPGVRSVNVEFLAAKEIVNSDWIVFPASIKSADTLLYSVSGNCGFAYERGALV